jgi:isoprenylcysteine carboxyl methyltransferase (ICMT) family protein YpbQ
VISVSPAEKEASPRWIVSVTAWIGFLFIILGFFMLQVRIYQLSSPWTVTLELLSTAAEFGAIWVWNNLFG